ncbi:MAG: FAD-dependent pyridine nucleotide-disulfide oxidoreductase [Pseudarthrobacter sp.]|nr:FAD-dependent pyridine nucleotide-disulfide oxidoreductase [Pseudarthrobacter sp.]
MDPRTYDVLVIGAGQAGLAAGHALRHSGLDVGILDASARVGDVWRQRWDSLKLFTPARYSALPGLKYPAGGGSYPTKDGFADYLESYAQKFQLPVRTGVRVLSVGRTDGIFELQTSAGPLRARNVIATPGGNSTPRIPEVARALDPGITQLHSSEYRGPAGIAAGDVVVAGAGTSGVEIALELAQNRPAGTVYLAGRPTKHIPDAVFRFAGPLYWRLVNSLLTLDTKRGRKVAAGIHRHGSPLIRVSVEDVERAGAVRLPRISGAIDGKPVFDVGTSDGGQAAGGAPATAPPEAAAPANVRTVIWATGYRPAFDWIEGVPLDKDGWPATSRGVVPVLPGLYFVGIPFQYALTSGLVGGVGRDAKYVVEQLLNQSKNMPVPDAATG